MKLFSKGYDVSFVERRRRLKFQTRRLSKQAQFLIGLTLAPPAVTLPVIERRRRSQELFAGHAAMKTTMLTYCRLLQPCRIRKASLKAWSCRNNQRHNAELGLFSLCQAFEKVVAIRSLELLSWSETFLSLSTG